MYNNKIAVIDLGTNTFHLLVIENTTDGIKNIFSEKKAVRIGQGGINHGYITEEACIRAINTLKEFKNICSQLEVGQIYATATSAFRNAKNGEELAKKIQQETSIKINIISGEKEAELIYLGVKEALDLGNNTSMIIDIGGGSVEFIICNKNSIFWKRSFEIGGQRLMDLFQKSDPMNTDEISELNQYLKDKLLTLSEAVLKHQPGMLVGSSGSFDTLSEMDILKKKSEYLLEEKKEYTISAAAFHDLYHELTSKNKEERMQIPGMIELRVDMIVVAAVLIRFILEEYQLQNIRVSTYALKEGVMSRIVKGESI